MEDLIDKVTNVEKLGYETPTQKEDNTYVICSVGNHSVLTTYRAFLRTVKKRGEYRCAKCVARSPEGRAQRSSQAVKIWNDPELSRSIREKAIRLANTDEGRAQRSIISKAAWVKPEFVIRQLSRISARFKSEAHRDLVSARNKQEYKKDPERYIKDKTSHLHTKESKDNHNAALARPEYRAKHRELALERFKDTEYKSKIAKGLESFGRGGKTSEPEKQVKSLLDSLSISYVYNKALGPYNFDFWIESLNLYIEVQGEYWHTITKNELRDRSKYTYLRTADPNAKIVYIWDYDFNSGNAEFKIKQALSLTSPTLIEYKVTDCELRTIGTPEGKGFLNTWHYAQFGKMPKYLIGVFLRDQLIAVVKFGPVSRKEVATSMGFNSKECFELDRFCIHPLYQKKNLGSYSIGNAARRFFQEFPEAKVLISFADSTFGHEGTIYKAANWTKVGTVKPDYVYKDPNGWVLHKKTVYNQAASVHMTEAAYVEKHQYIKVMGKEKTKFILKRSI